MPRKKSKKPKPVPPNPLKTARRFRRRLGNFLYNWNGQFYEWAGSHYKERPDQEVCAELLEYVDTPIRLPDHADENFLVSTFSALKLISTLPSDHHPPCWLNGRRAANCVSLENGLLNLETYRLEEHSPHYFTLNNLPYEYDPKAKCPQWESFLSQLWEDDQESVAVLQEVFGYLVNGSTAQQKMFLLIGPPRSGKGTIGRVVTALLGKENVASPTLASLSQNFGLQPLIGKTAAIISDARLRKNQTVIVERLLSVSGEDSLTVDRKYKPAFTGQLKSRFLILTNELPRLPDSSGAFVSRFIIFKLEHSFYGREDTQLTEKLITELPGIFNWALEGWKRLQATNYFIQPKSSTELLEQFKTLGSPIKIFVEERCKLVGKVETKKLFRMWEDWCESNGEYRTNERTFGRDLSAAFPGIQKIRPGSRKRQYHYKGISLRPVSSKKRKRKPFA